MTDRTRPRGFAPSRPKPSALALIEATCDALDEYRAHLPLTPRQMYYRVVAALAREGRTSDYLANIREYSPVYPTVDEAMLVDALLHDARRPIGPDRALPVFIVPG